jgi:hypothetical protein
VVLPQGIDGATRVLRMSMSVLGWTGLGWAGLGWATRRAGQGRAGQGREVQLLAGEEIHFHACLIDGMIAYLLACLIA